MPETMPEIEVRVRFPMVAKAVLALSWLWPYFGYDFARRMIQWSASTAQVQVAGGEWEPLFPEGVVL